jgi:hypothetical protein
MITETLDRVGTQVSGNSNNAVEMFRLINPASGAGTVTITFALDPIPNPFVNYAVGGVISFDGVNQITPNGAFFSSTATSSNPTVVVTGSASGDLVLDTLAVSPTALNAAVGPGQTEQWNGRTFFSNTFDIGAGSTEPAAAPVTMSWTLTNTDSWALGAIAVKAAPPPTASSVTIGGRILSKSGKGLHRAHVYLTDMHGETRIAITNPFGFYRFGDIQVGETYIFDISAKGHSFAPKVVTILEETEELNFSPE